MTGRRDDTATLVAIRVGAVVLLAAAWWLLAGRNEALRSQQQLARQREQLSRQVRELEAAVAESERALPAAGTGDSRWWRERLVAEALRRHLEVANIGLSDAGRPAGGLPVTRAEVVVSGTYESVLELIGWQETARPAARLERFSIEPAGAGVVRATLVLLLPAAGGGA